MYKGRIQGMTRPQRSFITAPAARTSPLPDTRESRRPRPLGMLPSLVIRVLSAIG
ncbi:hypothetical protein BJX66DRAFT_311466 [Aspergillus keveii]|uniref:Uncharacterized protein n=1 Tax=Aspergillus keveii TaxID=714993 RepID=A0ABR4FVB7_9EURO